MVPGGVFDIFLVLMALRGLWLAAIRRFGAGLAGCGAALALWLGLAGSGWYGRGAEEMKTTGLLILVFLGPSAVPAPTPRVPFSGLLAEHPVGGKLAMAALFLWPFAAAWRWAQALSPLADEASARKKLALVYLAPALLLVGQAVCLVVAAVAGARI